MKHGPWFPKNTEMAKEFKPDPTKLLGALSRVRVQSFGIIACPVHGHSFVLESMKANALHLVATCIEYFDVEETFGIAHSALTCSGTKRKVT